VESVPKSNSVGGYLTIVLEWKLLFELLPQAVSDNREGLLPSYSFVSGFATHGSIFSREGDAVSDLIHGATVTSQNPTKPFRNLSKYATFFKEPPCKLAN